MRASGPPPILQDFEDDFDFRGSVMDGGQEFSEIYIVERLIGMDDGSEDCDIHDYHGVCCDNKSLTTRFTVQISYLLLWIDSARRKV